MNFLKMAGYEINLVTVHSQCHLDNNSNCARSKGWRISGMIACWLINSLAYLVFQNDTWNLITRVAGMMLITLIVYSDNILKKMMAAILALSVGVISETIVWFIFMSGYSDSPSQAVMSVVSVLLYFMLLLLTEHFCRIRKADLFSDKYYLLIMVIPFLSICFIYLLFVDKVNDSLVLFVTLLTILVMNFFLFYLYGEIIVPFVYENIADIKGGLAVVTCREENELKTGVLRIDNLPARSEEAVRTRDAEEAVSTFCEMNDTMSELVDRMDEEEGGVSKEELYDSISRYFDESLTDYVWQEFDTFMAVEMIGQDENNCRVKASFINTQVAWVEDAQISSGNIQLAKENDRWIIERMEIPYYDELMIRYA